MRVVGVVSFVRAFVFAAGVCLAAPAAAQEPVRETLLEPLALTLSSRDWPLAAEPARAQSFLPTRIIGTLERPSALLPLYGSLIALQGLDIHSTRRGLTSGSGRELNPAMRPVVRNSAAFIATKAAATAGVIWASEKMWKKNRKAALIFTTLVNTAMAAVVANNYRVSR